MILDRAPKGRDEKSTMDFARRHDEYEDAPKRMPVATNPRKETTR